MFPDKLSLDKKCVDIQDMMKLDTPADIGLIKSLISESIKNKIQKLRANLGQLKKQLKDMVKDQRGLDGDASRRKDKDRNGKAQRRKKLLKKEP